MYSSRKGHKEAMQRAADRRQREDDAPRLCQQLPQLKALRIEIEEQSPVATTKYVKLVVVANAPALFRFVCGDPRCKDGGFDITDSLLRGLRAGQSVITGNQACEGTTGSASCGRSIRFSGLASFAKT